MKVLLFVLPLGVFFVDLYFRSDLFSFYSSAQMTHYLLSVLVSMMTLIFMQWCMFRWNNKKVLTFLFMGFCCLYLVIGIVASASFFYLNGLFPNFYTIEYLRTEPKSAMILLRDSLNLKDIMLLCLSGILIYVFFFLVVRRTNIKPTRQWVYITGILLFCSFSYLVSRHKKYDQCYTMDINLSASIIRHLFALGEERTFNGRGLATRNPVRLEAQKQKMDFNVLVILCESLRKQNLGAYGYKRNTSPHLDRFLKEHSEAVFLFENAYTVSSTTMLAVPAVLSGIAPYQPSKIFYTQPLIWDMGRAVGMRTFFLSSHTMQWYRFDRYYAAERLDYFWNKDNSGKPFFNDMGMDDAYTFRQLKRQLMKDEPFFGVVQLNATHYPYKVPSNAQSWKGSFEDEYNNAIHYQDSLIGELFSQLRHSGKGERTVLVFTSDHGESLKDHHTVGHVDSYYNEAISVPLIFYFPDKVRNELDCSALMMNRKRMVSTIDIAPTLVDLLDLREAFSTRQLMNHYSGYSLFKQVPEDRMLITMNNNDVARFKVGLSALSKGWHYIHRMNCMPERQEFYFTKWDKKERYNLFGRKGKMEFRRILKELKRYPTCEKYLP